MPIHFNDLDVVSEVSGLSSALIVPCYMCPAVTVASIGKRYGRLHQLINPADGA